MTAPLIIAPDVEQYLTTYIRSSLVATGLSYASGVTVSISVPDPLPTRLVVVRRDGGQRLDQFREVARFGVRVWAVTDKDANDLSAITAAFILSSPDGQPVLRARQLSGFSSVTELNPARRQRYGSFELIVRCTQLP